MLTPEKLKSIKVGTTLFRTDVHRGKGAIVVTKVGRNYFYDNYKRKYDMSTGRQVADFPGELYDSEEVFTERVKINSMWNNFVRRLTHLPPKDKTSQELEEFIKSANKFIFNEEA